MKFDHIKNNKSIGVGGVVEFKVWSKEENDVWKMLCERQLKNLEGRVSRVWKDGWDILGMSTEHIPDFTEVNKRLKELTGWEVIMTDIVFEDNIAWISALEEKKFRVTNYIRPKEDLDFTPLPDIFHDVFGHMLFLAIPQYARILEKFGKAMNLPKNKNIKNDINRLAWYAYEFGFMREDGEPKAFGTGLVSSFGELVYAFDEKVPKVPYDEEMIKNTDISPYEYHKKYFVLESLDQLEGIVDKYL